MIGYDPNQPESLSALLWSYVNAYWNDYLRYWEVTDHDVPQFSQQQREIHRHLDSVGTALRDTLNSLSPSAEATEAVNAFVASFGLSGDVQGDAAKWLRALHAQPLVRDCVAISLAFEVSDGLLPAAEKRAAELVSLLSDRALSEIALSYLQRATRLHLWGFDVECAILCRSVLEAALVARLRQQIELDEPPPSLDNLVRLAGKRGVLSGYQRANSRRGWNARRGTPLADADALRRLGNDLIHEVPDLAAHDERFRSSIDVFRLLVSLLGILFPREASA